MCGCCPVGGEGQILKNEFCILQDSYQNEYLTQSMIAYSTTNIHSITVIYLHFSLDHQGNPKMEIYQNNCFQPI